MLSRPMALGLALITAPTLLNMILAFSDEPNPPGFIWLFLGMGAVGFLLVLYCLLKGKTSD